jgi:hypothetical protein
MEKKKKSEVGSSETLRVGGTEYIIGFEGSQALPVCPSDKCEAKIIMKNGVFWVVTPCGSCKNRRFGGTWRLLHQGDKNR